MSEPLRRYLETHGGSGSPLDALAAHVARHGPPGAEEVERLGDELRLPPAAVRSALTFYDDLRAPAAGRRTCRGTSCLLAAAPRTDTPRQAAAEDHPVYCLGYCDRSPAALHPDGHLRLGLRRRRKPPSAPSIRCRSAEPIVTRHLANGGLADLAAARKAGVYGALEKALDRGPEWVLAEVERSGERGRGGAGFPAGVKWRRCAAAGGGPKVVVANGDEGDPGSFVDRVLMELDPHSLIEGILLCGLAVGADRGIVFVRSEYPAARERLRRAVEEAAGAGLLGRSVLGSGFGFELSLFTALGSYVCGEETAMLNAIEGRRGEVRLRPPYPVESGLCGRPTVVNNVETLVNIPWIVERGAEAYRALGTEASSGTKAICLNRGFSRPGIVEVEFGVSLAAVIEEEGGGGRDGARLDMVLLGGPMGSLLDAGEWDVPVCYGAMGERGVFLGHGGLVAIPEGADLEALLAHLVEFMAAESCGKCAPCRLGSARAAEMVERGPAFDRAAFERLMELMRHASLCAFGQMTPGPVMKLLGRLENGRTAAEGAP